MWRVLQLQTPTRRGPYFLTGLARLKPGAQIEQARAETDDDQVSLRRQQSRF